jgi:hypothetical protein
MKFRTVRIATVADFVPARMVVVADTGDAVAGSSEATFTVRAVVREAGKVTVRLAVPSADPSRIVLAERAASRFGKSASNSKSANTA